MASVTGLLIVVGVVLVLAALATAAAFARGTQNRVEELTNRLATVEKQASDLGHRLDGLLDEVKRTAAEADDKVREDLVGRVEDARRGLIDMVRDLEKRHEAHAAAAKEDFAKADAHAELVEQTRAIEVAVAENERQTQDQAEKQATRTAALQTKLDALGADAAKTADAAEVLRSEVARLDERGDAIETYIKDVLQEKLDKAFKAFDGTVGSVLGEMKDELLRGVSRIEQMESVVTSRAKTHERLLGVAAETPEALPEEVEAQPEAMEVGEEADAPLDEPQAEQAEEEAQAAEEEPAAEQEPAEDADETEANS